MKAKTRKKLAVIAVGLSMLAAGGFIYYRSKDAGMTVPEPERPINVTEP